MAVKSSIPDQDFVEILSHYELGEFQASEPIAAGSVQTNYFLRTESGRCVFRLYENRSMESVLFEAHLLQCLSGRGYPCPAPLPDRAGKLAGTFREKPFVLFEFIDGQPVQRPTHEQERQLIRQVAGLQNLTRGLRPSYTDYRWNYSPALCRRLARRAAAESGTAGARAKLAWLEASLAALDLPRSLPKGVCHCDFHFSNVLFKDGQLRALIDFDDANYTYLTYDLATLIEPFRPDFTWETWAGVGPEQDILDFTRARWVASEYQQHRPLGRGEKRHLFDVYKLSILIDSLWYFPRGGSGDFYEKRKLAALDRLGRDAFWKQIEG